jgi:hypothetical protein
MTLAQKHIAIGFAVAAVTMVGVVIGGSDLGTGLSIAASAGVLAMLVARRVRPDTHVRN